MYFPRITGAVLLGACAGVASAQEAKPKKVKPQRIKAVRMVAGGMAAARKPPTKPELKAKLEAKLKEPFVAAIAWEQDFEAAQRKSKDSGKRIFAYFTRSYAP